jgi:hypothetical protein
VKTARTIAIVALLWTSVALSALAQRMQFATPVTQNAAATAAPPSSVYVQPSATAPYAPPPLTPGPVVSSPAVVGSPAVVQPAPAAAPVSPIYAPPSTYGPVPSIPPGTAIQPPNASWDPYATPCNTPSPLLQQDPCLPAMAAPVSVATMQKFVQHIDFDYHWFAGNNGQTRHEELGINDLELSVTFAIPIFKNAATPLLITPGFAVHYWNGPLSLPPPTPPPDLPPRTYDAYLDASWNPQINQWLGAELDVRVGVYSDFTDVTTKAIRLPSKGVFVLSLSPSVKLKGGVWYLDRNVVKLWPAGGICWTPNPDIYFDILFPNPKIGKRLTTWGSTDWWLYASGDYGGGKWQIKRENGLNPNPYVPNTNGMLDTFDYNDIRVAVGLEFKTPGQFRGMFEVGGAFSRGVIYESYLPHAYYPNNTVFVRAGMSY